MEPFWQYGPEELLGKMKSSSSGLSEEEAKKRLIQFGPNSLQPPRKGKGVTLFLAQFKSPLILLLMAAAILSYFFGGHLDASIIFGIVFFSGLLGYWQERGALNALEKVIQVVGSQTAVRRDGVEREISMEKVVPGDVVVLRAGDLVPGDCLLLEAMHLYANEASLTGESAPQEKEVGKVRVEASQLERTNALFFGTMVVSGRAVALVVQTARETHYGKIAETIRFRPPETSFEMGVRQFGSFLVEVTLVLVLAIFGFSLLLQRSPLEALLFSLALAVGLTPQLLPAIISVNLAHGARKMAAKQVLVKHLPSIENFGQMDILCADKTGTITEGKMRLEKAADLLGEGCEKCAFFAFLNAHFQMGYVNPLDQAILAAGEKETAGWEKSDEIPYDFIRKRLSVVFKKEGKTVLIAKGALPQMLAICQEAEVKGKREPIAGRRKEIEAYFEKASKEGFRTLVVAFGETEEEKDLVLLGFLHFADPIKADIHATLQDLKKKGIHFKMITGDHHLVACHVAKSIGMTRAHLITGPELRQMSDEALLQIVEEKSVFAEIEPNQKEKIILSLKKKGHTVGFLGDGINDVSSLRSADVGISVDTGADAAKEASDIILLSSDLRVLKAGVEEGRRTFANTLKYVYMATSANFGNMFSMAGASLFLPFLPLLPKQVLLTNLLTDFPEMAIASDRVDPEISERPMKWDLLFIRRFMIVFGLLSSVFDYATFGILLWFFHADPALFRTCWFIESVVSATLVALVIRTRQPFFRSRPSPLLAAAIVAVAGGVLLLPYTPLAEPFGFVPIPLLFYALLGAILFAYLLSAEVAKHYFFRRKDAQKS